LETSYVALSLLLRTDLAKSRKDQNKPTEITLDPIIDPAKLCKMFSTVIDRVTKGSSLMERAEFDLHKGNT